jgi:hypothetical protein
MKVSEVAGVVTSKWHEIERDCCDNKELAVERFFRWQTANQIAYLDCQAHHQDVANGLSDLLEHTLSGRRYGYVVFNPSDGASLLFIPGEFGEFTN